MSISSRSDDGPKFTAEAMRAGSQSIGIKPIRIYPGSPWENGYKERFDRTLGRDVLTVEWFITTEHAQIIINRWLKPYNHTPSHQALDMRPPEVETALEKTLINGPDIGARKSEKRGFG